MIPMMQSKSSDDDRPMGLKFTRTNFFSFPKKDNQSPLKTVPPSQHERTTPPPMMNLKKDYDDHRSSNSSGASQASFPSPPVLSPTLPARSPFRIRDSQASAMNATNKIITSHVDSTQTRPNGSVDEQPTTIYSSISSSSSSSIATVEDDLTQELENIWKLKSNNTQQNQQKPLHIDINSEEMLLQLLISHAIIDARDYKVLSFEEFEQLKRHHARLKNIIKNSESKLEVDKKIQETSHSLSNLSSNKNRESVLLLLDEAVEADRKVKILTQRLTELKSEEVDTQYQVLQHTAGILCLGLQKMETLNQTTPKTSTPPISPQSKRSNSQSSSMNHQEKLQDLQSELESITQTLQNMLKRYDLKSDMSQTLSATQLLDRIEAQLDNYKSESKELESKLHSADERHRIESMSEKKLGFQLRAAREAAETKCSKLQQEIDAMHAKNKVDWLPQDNFDFADDSQIRIGELETELTMTKESKQLVENELQKGYIQVAQLKATLAEMELQSNKIQSQVAVFQSRENALKSEMEQYRDQVVKLRTDKEHWERTMKRRTVMQVLNNEAGANKAELEAKYEQQLEEQEQEYQAQLKEQAAFLDKTMRQCDHLRQEHDKLTATCKDLEILIRDKQKTLDARDVQVSKLESELQQQRKLTTAKSVKPATHPNDENLQQLQALFSEKEKAWIEQSSSMEANFEGILKEFDRLTGTAMEFETDRMNYERHIERLTLEVKDLESSLIEEKSKNLGYEADTPTTASLRKEFRKMVNDMKADHQRTLEREAEEKKRLEKQLKDLKHEREMSRYERINKGVQTLFIA